MATASNQSLMYRVLNDKETRSVAIQILTIFLLFAFVFFIVRNAIIFKIYIQNICKEKAKYIFKTVNISIILEDETKCIAILYLHFKHTHTHMPRSRRNLVILTWWYRTGENGCKFNVPRCTLFNLVTAKNIWQYGLRKSYYISIINNIKYIDKHRVLG